jgi:DNA-directed RNA polymerase subunit beta'
MDENERRAIAMQEAQELAAMQLAHVDEGDEPSSATPSSEGQG